MKKGSTRRMLSQHPLFRRPFFRKKWAALGLDIFCEFMDVRSTRSAAALTYFLIFSIFPMLLLLSAGFGFLHLDALQISAAMEQFMPEQTASIITDYLLYAMANQSPYVFFAALLLLLTTSSAAFRTLMSVSDDVYDAPGFPKNSGLWISFLMSLFLMVFIYAAIIVVLAGTWLFHLVSKILNLQLLPGGWVRFLLLLAIIWLFLSLFYRVSAPKDPRPPALPGAALVSLALVVFTALFSVFMSMSSRYSLIYGSLASVMILLLWLYIVCNIIILGMVLNHKWDALHRK